jgi:hypothetical protein
VLFASEKNSPRTSKNHYGLKPVKHTSMNCRHIKDTDNHQKEATAAANIMNGSIRNLAGSLSM